MPINDNQQIIGGNYPGKEISQMTPEDAEIKFQNYDPQFSAWSRFKAGANSSANQFRQVLDTSYVNAMDNLTDEKYTIERQKELYGEDYGRPLNRLQLEWIRGRKKSMQESEYILNKNNSWLLGMVGGVLHDPVGAAYGVLSGSAMSGVFASSAAKSAATAGALSKFLAVGGEVIGESTFETVYGAKMERDRNILFNMPFGTENIYNQFVGNSIGNVIGKGGSYALRRLFNLGDSKLKRLSPENLRDSVDIIDRQLSQGKLVDSRLINTMLEGRYRENPLSLGNSPFGWEKVNGDWVYTMDPKNYKFTDHSEISILNSLYGPHAGEEFGTGVSLVDNPQHSAKSITSILDSNLSNREISKFIADKNVKLFDLDKKLDAMDIEQFRTLFGDKISGEDAKYVFSSDTYKDLFTRARDVLEDNGSPTTQIFDGINKYMNESKGVSGYKMVTDSSMGKRNEAFLFNTDGLQEVMRKQIPNNSDLGLRLDNAFPDELRNHMQNKQMGLFHDEELFRLSEDTAPVVNKTIDEDLSELSSKVEETTKDLQEQLRLNLGDEANPDPELMKIEEEFKNITAEKNKPTVMSEATKAFFHCLTRTT